MARRKKEQYYIPSLFDEDSWLEKANVIEQAIDKINAEEQSNGFNKTVADSGVHGLDGIGSNLQGDQARPVEIGRDDSQNDSRGGSRYPEDIQSDMGANAMPTSGGSGREYLGARDDAKDRRNESGEEADLFGLREQRGNNTDVSGSELGLLETELGSNGGGAQTSNVQINEKFIYDSGASHRRGGTERATNVSPREIWSEHESVSLYNNRILDGTNVSFGQARDDEATMANGTQNSGDTPRRLDTQSLFDQPSQEYERSGLHGLGDIQVDGYPDAHGIQDTTEISSELGQQRADEKRLGDASSRGSIRGELRGGRSEESTRYGSDQAQAIQSGEILKGSNGHDFVSDGEVVIRGAVDKYTKNYEAIKLTKELIEEKKKTLKEGYDFVITKEQQEIIAQFSGWGDGRLANALFNVENIDWSERREQLVDLLGEDEYAEARAASLSAYYTPKLVVKSIYKALDRFGVSQNDGNTKKILEPSAGNGAFLQYGYADNYSFVTNELDTLSSNMLNLLYPNQKHYSTKFQTLQTPFKFDAVIGNPPYSSEVVSDVKNSDLHGEIADFFVAKSVRSMLKDDGIVAFVISSKFLDKKNTYLREIINREATFIGAVRLPNNAFKNAGTEVTTDIVFLQKGKNPNIPQTNWLETEEIIVEDESFQINKYFKEHPENVLGDLTIGKAFGGRHELSCKAADNSNLEESLNQFIETLPQNIFKWHEVIVDKNSIEIAEYDKEYIEKKEYYDGLKPKNFLIYNGDIYQKSSPDGEKNVFKIEKFEPKYKTDIKKVELYIKLRDCYNDLIRLENSDIPDNDENLVATRVKLNQYYDEFHEKFGSLRNKRIEKFLVDDSEDPDAPKVLMLDIAYNKEEKKYEKAAILSRRVNSPLKTISFNNAEEGLDASINLFGKPNIKYIADFLGTDSDKVAQELLEKGKIFIDPDVLVTEGREEYVIASKYLSGDVREKLKNAKIAAQTYPMQIRRNVASLEKVIPPDLKSSDIEVSMGVNWIPMKYYEDFFELELGINRNNWALERTSTDWIFNGNVWAMSDFNRRRLSVDSYNPFDICLAALHNEVIIIKRETDTPQLDADGSPKFDNRGRIMYKKEVDSEKTSQINAIISDIRQRFKEWVFKDIERRQDLEAIYNDMFNCYAKKVYDGSKLELENLDISIKLRKHQKDAVFRAINETNCLFDHEVGAGKTLSAICSIMKQKQLGIINKPLIAVLNSTVEQWRNEFMRAYPNANILVASEKSLSPKEKDKFLARIQNDNWDAVIITHTQFERIPTPPDIRKKVILDHIEELEASISLARQEAERNGGSFRLSVGQMEAKVKNLKEKLVKTIEKANKSNALNFAELGVDCLVVDEAHMYKNLTFGTHLKVKGLGNKSGSNKALVMEEITTYMNENNKKILFLTGTPISNSLSELFIMSKYLAPKELKRKGIGAYDSWSANFAKIEHVPELDATAKRYQLVSRFTALNNLPEVCAIYTDFADVINNDDIKKYNKNYVPSTEIVKSVSPINDLTQWYIGVQDENGNFNKGSICDRFEQFKSSYNPSVDNPLKATNDANKAGIDYRLIDPATPDDPNSKINECVKNILKEYQEWESDKGVQLVFLDIGTPKGNSQLSKNINLDIDNLEQKTIDTKPISSDAINAKEQISNDNGETANNLSDLYGDEDIDLDQSEDRDTGEETFFLYGDIHKKLLLAGIPREQIAFIHDTDGSNAKKAELFKKVNSGEVRILIGSTAKMGVGTNVQERVTAIHHLDVPWRPSDFVQRNGRVIRQGNKLFERDPENFKIKEFRYVTEHTYDAVKWQIIESKAKSLANFRKGTNNNRSLSGFEDDVASAAEMKAVATGNPLLLQEVKLKTELEKLRLKHKLWLDKVHEAEDDILINQKKKEYLIKRNEKLKIAAELIKNNSNLDELKCTMFSTDASSNVQNFDFVIPKENKEKEKNEIVKEQKTQMEEIFSKNVSDIFSGMKSRDFIKYKGFIVSGQYDTITKKACFELRDDTGDISFAPENLEYSPKNDGNTIIPIKAQLVLSGFLRRLDNFLNVENMETIIKDNEAKIIRGDENTADLKRWLSENTKFEQMADLELAEKEYKEIHKEIDKSAKDPAYKSDFSSKILEKIEQAKKSSERTTESIPQSNTLEMQY